MSNFPNAGMGIALGWGEEKAVSTTKTQILGARAFTPDGRIFRYALNAGTSIGGGKLVQNAVAVGSSVHAFGLVMSTVRHGDVLATGGNTSNLDPFLDLIMVTTNVSSANMYADGYLVVDTSGGPGGGALYMIKSHASGASGSSVAFNLYEEIRDAYTTVARWGVRRNPYDSVIIAPATTPTGIALGVTPREIPANVYFWLQEGGFGVLAVDDLAVAGQTYISNGSSAGNADAATTAGNDIPMAVVAHNVTAAAATDLYHFVRLKLT